MCVCDLSYGTVCCVLSEFVAGEVVETVIGLTNTNTEKEFIVNLIEGSFR